MIGTRAPGRAAAPAMRLGDLVAPLPVDAFLAAHWGRGVHHFPGDADRFAGLFDWDRLNHFLNWVPPARGRLELVRQGKVIERARYVDEGLSFDRIDCGAVTSQLSGGATMVMSCVDELDPDLAHLADAIGERLDAKCIINLYAGWRREHGFDLHWDDHDVFIVQIAGRKDWATYLPTTPNPVRSMPFVAPADDADAVWSGTLEQGDVLYIPRGYPHRAVPLGLPSLHLTVAIDPPNGDNFAQWIAGRMLDNPQVRSAVPRGELAAERSQWLDGFGQSLAGLKQAEALETFCAEREARRVARPRFALPEFGRDPHDQWAESTKFRMASRRRAHCERRNNEWIAKIGKLARPCSPAVAQRLAMLRSGRDTTLGALESGLDSAQRSELRQTLVMAQLGGELLATT